jgi:hypothetical protein
VVWDQCYIGPQQREDCLSFYRGEYRYAHTCYESVVYKKGVLDW